MFSRIRSTAYGVRVDKTTDWKRWGSAKYAEIKYIKEHAVTLGRKIWTFIKCNVCITTITKGANFKLFHSSAFCAERWTFMVCNLPSQTTLFCIYVLESNFFTLNDETYSNAYDLLKAKQFVHSFLLKTAAFWLTRSQFKHHKNTHIN